MATLARTGQADRTAARAATRPRRLSIPERFIEDVLSGRQLTSSFVRKQIERHARDLKDGHKRGLYFDPAEPRRLFKFFKEFLCHCEGEYDGQPFLLLPWQQAQLWMLYGWKRAGTGYRRFKFAYNEIGRGNGKSALASGLCIYELIGYGEAGAQVYSAATDKKTAKVVWDLAALMVSRSPLLRARITTFRENMHIPGTASKFEPCASEDTNLLGLKPSFICLDELHVHATSGVWDVFVSAMGKRRNPLLFAITNSGWDRHSVCWQQREYSIKVLDRVFDDDTWFAWISGIDEGDDWEDERTWIKANPALGTVVSLDDMRQQAAKARNDPSALNSFLRFRLSRWTHSHTAWMPLHIWDGCQAVVDAEQLRGRPCFGGLDLSTTTDISAFVLLFPPRGSDLHWSVLPSFFLPAESIEERVKRDRVPYDIWNRQGLFELTEGRIINYGFIRERINTLSRDFKIKEICFDRWNSSDIVRDLEDDGFTMVECGQGYASMNAPTKRLMELVLNEQLAHGGNPVLRWMASNAMASIDPAGNIKLDKAKSREKIDGMVAICMALYRAMLVGVAKSSIYETRGALVY
jgi:phage terminase large subunit-like protein